MEVAMLIVQVQMNETSVHTLQERFEELQQETREKMKTVSQYLGSIAMHTEEIQKFRAHSERRLIQIVEHLEVVILDQKKTKKEKERLEAAYLRRMELANKRERKLQASRKIIKRLKKESQQNKEKNNQ